MADVHRSTRCTGGPAAQEMRWYASDDVVRWTADGSHILLTYNGEVWAVTPDGARLWRLAQAWGQTEPGSPPTFGWMTSFDVTPDGKQVVYATCAYLPERLRGVRLEQLERYDFDYELAVVGLDGQAPRRLTRHPEITIPRGRRMARASPLCPIDT